MRGNLFERLLRDTRGATAIEYGLIVSLVIIGSLVALQGLADQDTGLWARVVDRVTNPTS